MEFDNQALLKMLAKIATGNNESSTSKRTKQDPSERREKVRKILAGESEDNMYICAVETKNAVVRIGDLRIAVEDFAGIGVGNVGGIFKSSETKFTTMIQANMLDEYMKNPKSVDSIRVILWTESTNNNNKDILAALASKGLTETNKVKAKRKCLELLRLIKEQDYEQIKEKFMWINHPRIKPEVVLQ